MIKKNNISVIRDREVDEITPVRAEQSKTRDDNEENYGAERAIDVNYLTKPSVVADTDGTAWIKLILDKTCVEHVIWYSSVGSVASNWTCTKTDCSNCEGSICSYFNVTTSIEGTVTDLSSVLNCRYGDTVKVERKSGVGFGPSEIAIIGRKGIHYTIKNRLSNEAK